MRTMLKYALLALFWLAMAIVVLAQTQTPNIGLIIPPAGSQNWDQPLNYNFNKIDQYLGGQIPVPNYLRAPFFDASIGYKINGSYGTAGQSLLSTGTGSQWGLVTGTGIAAPGANGEVLINSSGGVGSIPGFAYSSTGNSLSGNVNLSVSGLTAGSFIMGLGGGYIQNFAYNTANSLSPNLLTCIQADGTAHVCVEGTSYWNGISQSTGTDAQGRPVASVFIYGTVNCQFDSPPVVGNFVVPSTATNGQCHDSGVSQLPVTGTLVGQVTGASSGSLAPVFLMRGGGGGGGGGGGLVGSDRQITFNKAGTMTGDPNLTYNYNTIALNVAGSVSASVNSQANPVAYGATGGCPLTGSSSGCHDDSAAFTSAQAKVFVANNPSGVLYLPVPPNGGCYYIPTFVWYGVPIVGQQGSGNSKPICLRGAPGVDVLHPLADAKAMPDQNHWNKYWSLENLQLDLDDTVPCADSWNGNCAHRWPGLWFNDAGMTSGSATLTSAKGLFTCADIGQAILVRGAGVAGADLTTTISNVAPCWAAGTNSSWQLITLATTASTTVSNANGYKSIFGFPVTTNIGQSAIGFDMQDANTANWTVPALNMNASYVKLDNVTVSFVSGTQSNNAAASFMQGWGFYQGTARNFSVQSGGVFGWVQACPENNYVGTGTALQPCGYDHQQFITPAIQGPKYPWLTYGGSWGRIQGAKFASTYGLALRLGPILGTNSWNIAVGEGEGNPCTQGDIVEGNNHIFSNHSFSCTGNNVNVWIEGSGITGTGWFNNSSKTGAHLYLDGLNNTLSVYQTPGINGWLVDRGFNNRLEWTTQTSPHYGVFPPRQVIEPTKGYSDTAGVSTSDFLRNGDFSTPYTLRDLWIWPTDIIYNHTNDAAGTTWTLYEVDPTSPTGYTFKLQPSQTYSAFRTMSPFSLGNNYLMIGVPDPLAGSYVAGQGGILPAGKGTAIVLAKCDSGITSFTMTVNSITPNATIGTISSSSCTTTFQTFTASYDATAYSGGHLSVAGVTSTVHFAWIGFMPQMNTPLIQSSVNKVLNVMAPPYNAYCDLNPAGSTTSFPGTITISTSGVTSGITFLASDVNKRIVGYTISAPFVPFLFAISSVSGGNATVTPLSVGNPSYVLSPLSSGPYTATRWYYGHDDQSAATNGGVGTGIQGAFNDAATQAATVQIPSGTCLTSTITWKGNGFFGAGVNSTYVQGMPGADVFATPNSSTAILNQTSVRDLTIRIDTSVDASNTTAGGNNTYPNRYAGVQQGGAQFNPPIVPGPMQMPNGMAATSGTTTVTLSGSGTTMNMTGIPPSRVIGSPITINGAGASGGVYTSTIAGIGAWVSGSNATQTLTLTDPIQTTVTNASGTLLNPLTPPWYVGNAGIAIPCDAGTGCNGFGPWVFRNLMFNWANNPVSNASGTTVSINNASHCVGFFTQSGGANRFDNIFFSNLYAAYVETYPTAGPQSTADTMSIKDMTVNTATINMVTVSGNNRTLSGINLFTSGMPEALGPMFLSTQTTSSGWNVWTINDLYVEGATQSGENSRFSSGPYTVNGAYMGGTGYAEILGTGSTFNGAIFLPVRLDGNQNIISTTGLSPGQITDNGMANRVENFQGVGGGLGLQARRWNPSPRPTRGSLNKLDASFLFTGNSAAQYLNLDDLVTTCEDWWTTYVPGHNSSFSCNPDPTGTEIVRSYFRNTTPAQGIDLGAASWWAGSQRVFGVNVPQTRIMTYIVARCPGASSNCTFNGRLRDANTNVYYATGALSFGTNWTVQSWLSDLTAAPYGDVLAWRIDGGVNTGTSLDIAMIAFMPVRTDPLNAPAWDPYILYSAAGTPLPPCNVANAANNGMQAVVSDATSPTYMGAYTSGGAITAAVICSYNGTTYSWLTR